MVANRSSLRNESLDELGTLINKLMDLMTVCGQHLPISLPRIAVVGAQSVGKSSVLENLAGREFFPRGAGMVTRCPLVLQMKRIGPNDEAYMEFYPSDGRRYYGDLEVQEAIRRITDHQTSGPSCISDAPINLKLFSPDVLDLTLVDLPGLIKNPLPDQPEDIDEQVKKLVESYIQDDNTIILAVSAGNYDIAASDSLQMAKRVDPEGKRTIGVLTKLDLVSPHDITVITNVLDNKHLPLKLGYVGVVNPEIDSDVDNKDFLLEKMRKKEEKIIEGKLPALTTRHGTRVLQETLAQELSIHIHEKAPKVKEELEKRKEVIVAQLKKNGAMPGKRGADLGQTKKELWECIRRYGNELSTILGMTVPSEEEDSFGPRFRHMLDSITREIQEVEKPNLDQVKTTILNVLGIQSAVSSPQQVFNTLVAKMSNDRFKEPVIIGISNLTSLMEEFMQDKLKVAAAYPALQTKLMELMQAQLEANKEKCLEYVDKFFRIEGSFPNFNHPEFIFRMGEKDVEDLKNRIGKLEQEHWDPEEGNPAINMLKAELVSLLEAVDKKKTLRVDLAEKFQRDAEECLRQLDTYMEIMEMTIVDQVRKALAVFILEETVIYAKENIFFEDVFFTQVEDLMEFSSNRRATIETLQHQHEAVMKALAEVKKVRSLSHA